MVKVQRMHIICKHKISKVDHSLEYLIAEINLNCGVIFLYMFVKL